MYDSDGNLTEDKYLQGEDSKNALVLFYCRTAGDCALRNELDDEIALNYFGARYLDPMLGMWISVDAARQYQNPYLYAGNNPVMRVDPDGNQDAQSIANAVQKQVSAMNFERFVVKPLT